MASPTPTVPPPPASAARRDAGHRGGSGGAGSGRKFVFHDLGGKRWPRTRRLLVLGAVLVFVALVLFVQSLLTAPRLHLPFERKHVASLIRPVQRVAGGAEGIPGVKSRRPWAPYELPNADARRRAAILQNQLHPRPARAGGPPRVGYYVAWDPNSTDDLLAHADRLTHVVTEWFTLTGPGSTLHAEKEEQLLQILNGNRGLTLMPLLTNLSGDNRQPEPVENLIRGSEKDQDAFIADLRSRLAEIHAGGVVVDWELVDPAYKVELTEFLRRLATGLHDAGLQLWLQVQVGDEMGVYDLETLADDVDFFLALLHDQTSDTDPPGPIAGQDWFNGWLGALSSYGDPDQWIISLGNYGYDWAEGARHGDPISFADAMSRAGYAGEETARASAAPSYNPTFSYTLAGVNHTVWFLDAVTFLNQARAARARGFHGLAVNRLGSEDPALWQALELVSHDRLTDGDLEPLRALKPGRTITNIGTGGVVTVDISPEDGQRRVRVAADDGDRVEAVYDDYPQYASLYHQGDGGEHQVALTFDDGPSPKWTPKVLDILKQKRCPAAFFMVGKNAEDYPDLVRRVVREGHEIGNHTYYHTNLAVCPDWQTRTELNATQRLLEDLTGRSTTFFRPPYNADTRPNDLSELAALDVAQKLDYLTVLEDIDPEDWARPGADVIFERVKTLRRQGSLILLHDAGGDRAQTVEALPKIIDYLRARGDTIVPVSQLLGLKRDDVNPPLTPDDQSIPRWTSNFVFRAAHLVLGFLWAFMIVATVLVAARTALVVWLAVRQRRKAEDGLESATGRATTTWKKEGEPETAAGSSDADFAPPLSVVIAAYNEGKVIASTLRSVLDTDYPGEVEVVVVDDGSKDDTAEVVTAFAKDEPRVRLLRQPNGGKSVALAHGVAHAHHEILVFLDADTHFDRRTLGALVAPFRHPKVGAVSGHARVGNPRTFIARCQALEYICGFNLDRRAYDYWNCITVVPGAISALRRRALESAGGFNPDTLAEDTDLTLSLHRRGWRMRYAADAHAYTEAPETVRTLAKQRFRWCYGTMQCLWKHRDMLFNPRFRALGLFSLPGVWFFQILLVALTPVVDLILIGALFAGNAHVILPYVLAFLLLDQLLAVLACLLEREPLRRSWLMVPMRLIYRPLLSWVVWKSIVTAARGVLVGWGKLERTAGVTVPAR